MVNQSHPCRQMPTRHCPTSYDAACGDRPCARFESNDESPWMLDWMRHKLATRLTERWLQRAADQVRASPEEHCADLADYLMPLIIEAYGQGRDDEAAAMPLRYST